MTGKSILITGCSSGIGLCAATSLKERGYRVFATARKPADVARLQALGLESLLLDLNDSSSIQQAVDEVLQRTEGKLYALFNNAGYLQAGAIEDLTREMNRDQFEANVFGPLELTRLVLPAMRKLGQGRIIQNSSILGIITSPYYGAYNASKFALEGYFGTLRQELRGTNIHVSLINPGPIITQLRENAFQHYQQTLNIETSLHKKAYEKMEQSYFKPSKADRKIASPPDAVMKQLIHALESKHPKAHYFVGSLAKILALLKRILPDSALDWVLSKT